jgi:hypothetical protein
MMLTSPPRRTTLPNIGNNSHGCRLVELPSIVFSEPAFPDAVSADDRLLRPTITWLKVSERALVGDCGSDRVGNPQ